MFKNSYSASCNVNRDKDGKYYLDCYFASNGKHVYTDCSGTDFTECLNTIIKNIENEMKPKEKTLEEQIAELRKENKALKTKLNNVSNNTVSDKKQNKGCNNFKKSEKLKSKSEDTKKTENKSDLNSAYENWFKIYEDFGNKLHEGTKDMSDEEYINYILKLFGIK